MMAAAHAGKTGASAHAREAASRSHIVRGLIRAIVETAVLVALYFLLPLDGFRLQPAVVMASATLVLASVTVVQVRAIMRARYPGIRATEALAIVAPLYLLLFATTYFFLATADPVSFTGRLLSRVDALYFTVTVFSTVGFGDISPATDLARLVVTIQMVLNLVVLGAGIRLLTLAVSRGRAFQQADEGHQR